MTTTPTPTPRVRGALPPPISLQHPLRPLPCVQASAPRRTVRTTTHTAAGDRGVRRQWVCAASTHNAANAAAAEGTDGMDRQGTHPLPQPLSDEVALWWLQDTPREHPIPTPPRKCPFHKTVACTPHSPSHPRVQRRPHPLGHCVHGWVPIPQNATRAGPMEAPPRLWRGGPHTQRTHERTPLRSPETPSTPPPTPSKSNRGGRGSWPIATKHADIGSSSATAHTRFCPGINQRRRIPATEVTHRILAWHGFSFLLRLLQRHSCTTRLLILLVPNHSCKR